ncbi:SHIRT domain-containing protein [[Clostridium] innocuum]|nr:SHIRT domain-containing protein [[Clostridium] innocuum]
MKKKILAFVMTILMVFSSMPNIQVFAENEIFHGIDDVEIVEGETLDLLKDVHAENSSGESLNVEVKTVTSDDEEFIYDSSGQLVAGKAGATYEVFYIATSTLNPEESYEDSRKVTSVEKPVDENQSKKVDETNKQDEKITNTITENDSMDQKNVLSNVRAATEYSVSSNDDLDKVLMAIGAQANNNEAVITLNGNITSDFSGVAGKHITLKSSEDGLYSIEVGSELQGDVTFDNVKVTGGTLYCNGHRTIFTENSDLTLTGTLYGGANGRTVDSTYVKVNGAAKIDTSDNENVVIGGSYKGSVEGDIYVELAGDISFGTDEGGHYLAATNKGTAYGSDKYEGDPLYVGGNVTLILDSSNMNSKPQNVIGAYNSHVKGNVTVQVKSGNTSGIEGMRENPTQSIVDGDIHIIVGDPSYENTNRICRIAANWDIVGAGEKINLTGNLYQVGGNVTIDTYENVWGWDTDGAPNDDPPGIVGAGSAIVAGDVTINARGSHLEDIIGVDHEGTPGATVNGNVVINVTNVDLRNSYNDLSGILPVLNNTTIKQNATVNLDGGSLSGIYGYGGNVNGNMEININGNPVFTDDEAGVWGVNSTASQDKSVLNFDDAKTSIPIAGYFTEVNVTKNSDVTLGNEKKKALASSVYDVNINTDAKLTTNNQAYVKGSLTMNQGTLITNGYLYVTDDTNTKNSTLTMNDYVAFGYGHKDDDTFDQTVVTSEGDIYKFNECSYTNKVYGNVQLTGSEWRIDPKTNIYGSFAAKENSVLNTTGQVIIGQSTDYTSAVFDNSEWNDQKSGYVYGTMTLVNKSSLNQTGSFRTYSDMTVDDSTWTNTKTSSTVDGDLTIANSTVTGTGEKNSNGTSEQFNFKKNMNVSDSTISSQLKFFVGEKVTSSNTDFRFDRSVKFGLNYEPSSGLVDLNSLKDIWDSTKDSVIITAEYEPQNEESQVWNYVMGHANYNETQLVLMAPVSIWGNYNNEGKTTISLPAFVQGKNYPSTDFIPLEIGGGATGETPVTLVKNEGDFTEEGLPIVGHNYINALKESADVFKLANENAKEGRYYFKKLEDANKGDKGYDMWQVAQDDSYSVLYKFKSGSVGEKLPKAVEDMLPIDAKSYFKDDTVTALAPDKIRITDSDTGKTWVFKGYDAESKVVSDDTLEKGEDPNDSKLYIRFEGTWVVEYKINYEFVPEDSNMTLPEEVLKQIPSTGSYEKGGRNQKIYPSVTEFDSVSTSSGTWEFDGWDAEYKTAGKDITFTGTWKFKKNEYHVTYEFESGTTGKGLPDEVNALLPTDSKTYEHGTTVTAINPQSTEVEVTDGVWLFQGWNKEKVENVSEPVTFTGTWEFVEFVSVEAIDLTAYEGGLGSGNSTVTGNALPEPTWKNDIKDHTFTVDGKEWDINDKGLPFTWKYLDSDMKEVVSSARIGTYTLWVYPLDENKGKYVIVDDSYVLNLPENGMQVSTVSVRDITDNDQADNLSEDTFKYVYNYEATTSDQLISKFSFFSRMLRSVSIIGGNFNENGTHDGNCDQTQPHAHVAKGTKFYKNGNTSLPVNSNAMIGLLYDDLLSDMLGNDTQMNKLHEKSLKANGVSDILDTNYTIRREFKYLDLVDMNDGNVWVGTADETVTVYMPYTDDMTKDDSIVVTYFDNLTRDYTVNMAESDLNAEIDKSQAHRIEVTKTDTGILFDVPSKEFGPFEILYQKNYGVEYQFESNDKTLTLPEEVIKLLPEDTELYADGSTVKAETVDSTEVKVGNGIWIFKGWDADEKTVSGKVIFTGIWEFKKNEYSVSYKFESATDGKDLPEEVNKLLPVDDKLYEHGSTVKAVNPESIEVQVSDGVWQFKSWDKTEVQNIEGPVTFTGTWEFIKDEAVVPVPDSYKVVYSFKSETEGLELPKEVLELLPVDDGEYVDGTKVKPLELGITEVKVNGGKWVFKNWDKDEEIINGEDITFIGGWIFEKTEEITVLPETPEKPNTPSIPNTNVSANENKKPSETISTGDNSDTLLWSSIMATAGVATLVLLLMRKKDKLQNKQ